MLQNTYSLAKIGADTDENEQHFAEILPKTGNYPTGPPGAASALVFSASATAFVTVGAASGLRRDADRRGRFPHFRPRGERSPLSVAAKRAAV